jgi:hypothetical protein
MRRTAVLAATGWLVAAVAAIVAGVATVTLIGRGLVGPEPDDPMSSDEVVVALADTPPTGGATPTGTPSATPTGTPSGTPTGDPTATTPPAAATLLRSPAGSVTARCVGGKARLDYWSPAPGYTVGEVDDDRVTFTRGDDEEVEARVRCESGVPVLEVKQD